MTQLDPLACAATIIAGFIVAGALHTVWLRSHHSKRFTLPLDGYRTFRGRRVFGNNKTLRGFIVMVPAVGIAFLAFGYLRAFFPDCLSKGMWSLSPLHYGLLGLYAGFGFMVAELPNSFCKRQLGIAPGQTPSRHPAKALCFIADRIDSIIGALIALALVVPIPWLTWLYVLAIGSGIHWFFSALLYHLNVKARPA